MSTMLGFSGLQGEKMFSVKEVAGILGVSRDAVVRLIRRGKLLAVKFPQMGGRGLNITWRIPSKEIARFIKENLGGR